MEIPSISELRPLLEQHNGPCISMFLPTHRAGKETQQDPLRLRNHIRAAENRLLLDHLRTTQVEHLLQPIQALLEDEPFCLRPGDGLALFRSPDMFRTYWLPSSFQEQVVVTGHFYLKPLLPFLSKDERFSILAREQAAARYRQDAETERASHNVREIIPAAFHGRVESLFIAIDQEQWGTFHPATNMLHVHRVARYHDDDLLDIAATQTLLHSGSVYAVEQAQVPGGELVAAVFRY
jgi:hypothetical protein